MDLAAARTFPVFTFSWGLVLLFGMSSEVMAGTLLSVLVCMTGFLAMVRPGRPWALALVSASYVVHWLVDDYRHPFVHTWFDFWGCVLLLLGLLASYDRDEARWKQRFVAHAGPAAVALAAVAFFAAGVAKLNIDYFTPERSCAVTFYEWQRTYPPYSFLLPTGAVGDALGMYGTVVAELVAPVLWLHHRTRKIGFFLGFALLFLLGTNAYARYYVFTGPFIAHLALGFDWRRSVGAIEAHLGTRPWLVQLSTFVLAFALLAAMTVGASRDGLVTRHLIVRSVFVVYAAFVTVGVALAPPIRFGPVWPVRARPSVAWAVVLFIACFELLPYFGMRTSRNFTMAANFVLDEGYSNHLVFRRPLPFPVDRSTFAETFGWSVRKTRPRQVDCGKKRVPPDQRNHPPAGR